MRVRELVTMPDGTIRRGRFDGLTRFLHWLTVMMVLFQFGSGWLLADGSGFFAVLLLFHRSSGAAVWCLTGLRLLWRASFAAFPPFPPSLPALMRRAAKASEFALYLLLICEPLTGAADTLLRGRPFALFVWTVPALLPSRPLWSGVFHLAHVWGAWALTGLAGGHALAALFHHFVLKDDVLDAMLPANSCD